LGHNQFYSTCGSVRTMDKDERPAHVFSKDGTEIAYDKIGSGPAIILVSGALGSRLSWVDLPRLLSSNFAVIAYDRRGRGASANTMSFSLEREIEDLEALIDQVAGGSASLYGISSGGALALESAARLGRKVKKLALYEVPYSTDEATRSRASEYQRDLMKALSAGDRSGALELFMKLVGVPREQIQGMHYAPIWKEFELVAPTLEYDSMALGEGFSLPKDRVSRISMPTIVVVGEASPQFLQDSAKELKDAIPNAKLRSLQGQTHDVQPEAIAPVLKEFLS
jgi:pimeloyl-ACP methyl ester carboxylesterase